MNKPDLTTPLTAEEFAALQSMTAQINKPRMHLERLKSLGLIEQKLGGWVLSQAGKMRIKMGK